MFLFVLLFSSFISGTIVDNLIALGISREVAVKATRGPLGVGLSSSQTMVLQAIEQRMGELQQLTATNANLLADTNANLRTLTNQQEAIFASERNTNENLSAVKETENAIKVKIAALEATRKEIVQRKLELEEDEKHWNALNDQLEENARKLPNKIVLNVGGKTFVTFKETLMNIKDTYFYGMLKSDRFSPDPDGSYFIDRNPTHFPRILDYMRMGVFVMDDLSKGQMEEVKFDIDFRSGTSSTTTIFLLTYWKILSNGNGKLQEHHLIFLS
jgi:BTB/POZ domain